MKEKKNILSYLPCTYALQGPLNPKLRETAPNIKRTTFLHPLEVVAGLPKRKFLEFSLSLCLVNRGRYP